MTYCYTPIDSPAFLSGEGDCDTVGHNLAINSGTLVGGDDLISAVLIQLGTDARANDERGWWGDEFETVPIGNTLWTLSGQAASAAGVAAQVDEKVRAAMSPLMRAGLIRQADVATVKTISGFEVSLTLARGDAGTIKATING